jgi:HD-GYP domain-containing protein (c-di-GMP phosphodiesterase class II)
VIKHPRSKQRGSEVFPIWFLEFENHGSEPLLAHNQAETYKAFIRDVSFLTQSRDPYTAGHQWKVSELAGGIAREMGLPAHTIEGIKVAGMVHDMGKLSVPAEIVTKPGALTSFEFSIIKEHPARAFEVLKEIDFPWPVAEMVLQHHERLDGSGYPSGLKGDEIGLEARVLAVADVVGAISSHRPYRRDLGIEAALKEIDKKKGVLYDTEVSRACRRSIKGSKVFMAHRL